MGNWPTVCKWAVGVKRETTEGERSLRKKKKKKKKKKEKEEKRKIPSDWHCALIMDQWHRSYVNRSSDQRRASFLLPARLLISLMYSIDSRCTTSRLSFLLYPYPSLEHSVISLYELFIWPLPDSTRRCLNNRRRVLEPRVYFYDPTLG